MSPKRKVYMFGISLTTIGGFVILHREIVSRARSTFLVKTDRITASLGFSAYPKRLKTELAH